MVTPITCLSAHGPFVQTKMTKSYPSVFGPRSPDFLVSGMAVDVLDSCLLNAASTILWLLGGHFPNYILHQDCTVSRSMAAEVSSTSTEHLQKENRKTDSHKPNCGLDARNVQHKSNMFSE